MDLRVVEFADRLGARWTITVGVAIVTACLLYGQGAFHWGTDDRTVDSYTYTLAAKTLADGGNPYDTEAVNAHAPDDLGFVFPYLYPPPLAIALAPWAAADPVAVHHGFVVVGVVLALVNVGLIWILAAPTRFPRGWLVLMLAAVAVVGPVVSTIRLGQINSWVVLFVLLALWAETRNRPWMTGLCLAGAILLKVAPFVFLADLVFRRRWKSLFAAGLFAAGIVGASIAVAGTEVWAQFIDRAGTPLPFNPPMSLRGLVDGLDGFGVPESWRQTIALALLTVTVVWMIVRLPRMRDAVSSWSFLAFFSLLASPLTWHHHYYLALLPYGVGLVRRTEEPRPAFTAWVWLALAGATLLRYPGVLAPLKPIATFVAFIIF